jgi:hypothetical protein
MKAVIKCEKFDDKGNIGDLFIYFSNKTENLEGDVNI